MAQHSMKQPPLIDAMLDQMGGDFDMNYFTHLDTDLGFIYIAAHAVANVRTAGSLNMAVAEAFGSTFDFSNLAKLFDRKTTLAFPPRKVGYDVFENMLEDQGILKFAFVRDPVERFAVVYANTFSINAKKNPARKAFFKHLKMSDDENLSMLDLAELLCEEGELKPILPHIRPQRRALAYDLVTYDFIGHHESWAKDFGRISSEIFGQDVAHFDPIKTFGRDPEGVELKINVDTETRAAIREAYHEDYEMLEEIAELFPDGFALPE